MSLTSYPIQVFVVIRYVQALWIISIQAIPAFYGCDLSSNEGRQIVAWVFLSFIVAFNVT
jgi:hypothetical protein